MTVQKWLYKKCRATSTPTSNCKGNELIFLHAVVHTKFTFQLGVVEHNSFQKPERMDGSTNLTARNLIVAKSQMDQGAAEATARNIQHDIYH